MSETNEHAASPDSVVKTFVRGVAGRCPRCGDAGLFAGFLKIASRCDACGLDFTPADPGDGPAVFVMFAVGFIVVPIALVLELAGVPGWLNLSTTIPLAIALCVGLLRPFKGVLVALQFKHKASQAGGADAQF